MLPVSFAYQTAIQKTVRLISPRVTVTWTDPSIDLTLNATSNDDNRVTRNEQTADLITEMTHKWAHLDSVIKADGTYYAMPGVGETNQCGWYGATQCGLTQVWPSTNPILTTTFAARPVNFIRVVGDNIYNEWPEAFTIKFYNGAVLEHTEAITGNSAVVYEEQLTDVELNSITKMTLEIFKWSTPSRVVKIAEFYSDVVEVYTGTQVVSMGLLEERELADNSLPVGNIASNEIDISLENVNNRFFPGNTDSPLHTVIKRNRKIQPELGVLLADGTYEYISLGTFWSGDWSVPEQGNEASTAARDRMELLRKITYDKSLVWNNVTLYALATTLLTEAVVEMDDLTYNISTALQNYTIEWAYFPRQSYFDCLRDIAGACTGQVYMDRNDVLQLIGPD